MLKQLMDLIKTDDTLTEDQLGSLLFILAPFSDKFESLENQKETLYKKFEEKRGTLKQDKLGLIDYVEYQDILDILEKI